MSVCAECGAKGRPVDRVTLESQVEPLALRRIADRTGWSFCGTSNCDVVYFHGSEVVLLRDGTRVPFQKSSKPDRLVCYCFAHTVEEVSQNVSADGTSSIRDSIKAACKAGLDRCPVENPQGRCCLGNVGRVIREQHDSFDVPATDCCAPAAEPSSAPRSGLFLFMGAVGAAALSSACCWLPLLAIILGASATGVGAFFEAFRVPLLVATVGLLGGGFYLAYRKPACAVDGTCEVQDTMLPRLNRALLWLTTLVVIAFAAFPQYVGALTGGDAVQLQSENTISTYYKVEGMTCGGCEVHTREAVEEVPGVVSAAVSFRDERALVVWDGSPDHAAVIVAIESVGYSARLLE